MGNAAGKNDSGMKTTALASYMTFDRRHCIQLRNSALELTDPNTPYLSVKVLMHCLELVGVEAKPDAEIILDLYTMWDIKGDGRVPLMPFFVGLCPLSCQPNETFRSVLRFVFSLADLRGRGEIDSEELFVILKSLNCTISYLGDGFLRSQIIYKIAQDAVESIECTRPHSSGLRNQDVVNIIAAEPLILNVIGQRKPRRTRSSGASTVSFAEKAEYTEYDDNSCWTETTGVTSTSDNYKRVRAKASQKPMNDSTTSDKEETSQRERPSQR
mmetsp:Transcript_20029/g.25808  ORF Transcript_20029/g.25808 Transcript_20029/m.25808 type:complete len:271 (+) Transcript_20029:115-927(+)|eukprot:CAMPEP_0198147056 /NCGR_PEP_ID=MMETSP1443-20131203/33182_1 /TAXON_ID=186043 /ORGANISM="Entomoneis sp., Strain CCMP2396" /LENGTH=270 /DNA_ID=CAMNT_0043811211 /DNA_START=99 /DNA_END=911 /DNA_ORIENTATION=-